MRTETEAFLDTMLPRQTEMMRAFQAGDAGPRLALWSHRDPVTLFGAWVPVQSGWTQLEPTISQFAARFAAPSDHRLEIHAAGAGGDLAYLAAFEHSTVQVDGAQSTYTLRTTHVYRREDGEWKIVHRHSDYPPADGSHRLMPAWMASPAAGVARTRSRL